MLGTTYLTDELRTEIRWSEISDRPADLSKAEFIDQVLRRSSHVVQYGFPHITFAPCDIRGKIAYELTDLPSRVVLRRMNRNLKLFTGTKQTDRTTTVRRLSKLLREGVRHRVYKFDIQSFYESVDIDDTWSFIDDLPKVDRKTSTLLRSFIELCRDNDVSGVPRGLSISATLAELTLRRFDDYVRRIPGTYFYARYVDDIAIVTSGSEDAGAFTKMLEEQLPPGLRFHPVKSQPYELMEFQKNAPEDIRYIDFLGYKISVSQIVRNEGKKLFRRTFVDISDKKANRIKSRIVKSIIEFDHNENIEEFLDRIRMLSGNYNLFSRQAGKSVNVGLYCNYRLIDVDQSSNLREIDRFYRAWVLGHCGPISARFSAAISEPQRRALLKYSFLKSYKNKSFYHFDADRLTQLKKCWKYA